MPQPDLAQKPQPSKELAEPPRQTNKLRELTRRYAQALRDDGPTALVAELRSTALYQLHKHLLDKLAKFAEPETVRQVTGLASLTIDSNDRDDGVEYVPTPHRVLDWIQSLLPDDKSNWAFIDVGAGRGRVVAAAAGQPYRKVLGIEFAAELHADAERHLQTFPPQAVRAGSVSIILADAADFEIPDGPCIFYLFNPFGPVVMRKFLSNVVASYQEQPRQMLVAYFNPQHSSVMAEFSQIHKCSLPMSVRFKFAALSPNDFALYAVV